MFPDPRLCRLSFEYPGSAGAGPRHMQVAVTLVMPNFLRPCGMWPARGVLQERILEDIGQYWLPCILEHYISCCPSHQLPRVSGTARTFATQAAAPPPHLALKGANPSHPGQPQEQSPVGNPHVEVEKKTQNLSTSCASCRLNLHDQLADSVSMEYIKGH